MPFGSDVEAVALVAVALMLAGVLKGATGIGYSTCALPLLTAAVGLKAAIGLVLVPAMASNLALMWSAGHWRETINRFWPLYLAMLPGIAVGVALLAISDGRAATAALGAITVVYVAISLARLEPALGPRLESRLKLPVGLVNGVLTGLTGSQILPLVPYMLALKMEPERFVPAVNLAVTIASLVMMAGLAVNGLLPLELALLSLFGVVPAILGTSIGNQMRVLIPKDRFRTVVLVALGAMGVTLIVPQAKIVPGAPQMAGLGSAGSGSAPVELTPKR